MFSICVNVTLYDLPDQLDQISGCLSH